MFSVGDSSHALNLEKPSYYVYIRKRIYIDYSFVWKHEEEWQPMNIYYRP